MKLGTNIHYVNGHRRKGIPSQKIRGHSETKCTFFVAEAYILTMWRRGRPVWFPHVFI